MSPEGGLSPLTHQRDKNVYACCKSKPVFKFPEGMQKLSWKKIKTKKTLSLKKLTLEIDKVAA